jgi:putative inorganic carbon (HCO3(-)) transporter
VSLRDPFVFAIVFGSLPFILRRPHVGVLMWVWISVMNPHRLAWSWAYNFNFAAIIAAVTLLSVAINKNQRRSIPFNSLTIALLMFFGWTGVTSMFGFYPEDALVKWTEFLKTMIMALMIPMVIYRKEHVRQLLWVTLLSVAYYGTKGGVWVLLTGGGNRVWGPEQSYIYDNNALAVALVMMIPLLRYLQLTTTVRHVRWGLTAIMLLCGVSVIGSFSRGALLAIGAMIVFFCWKTKRKLQVMLILALAVPCVLAFMPKEWYARMDTIQTYEQDSSALMRLNAWGAAMNIANDRPLVGGGFEMESGWIYQKYAPDPKWPPQVPHSIYFQALGEHGYVGLMFFLWLYFLFWRHAAKLIRMTRGRSQLEWAYHFGLMTQVSIIPFLVGGAFLSLILFDVPYYLVMILLVIHRLVNEELSTAGTAETAVPRWRTYSTLSPPPSTSATRG